MRIFLTILSLVLFGSACQTQNLGFISSDKKEVTIGYIKYLDDARRAESSQDTDADIAIKASVDYINQSKEFPFRIRLLTVPFSSSEGSGLERELHAFTNAMSNAAAWIGSKSTAVNLSLGPITLASNIPVFFPITSKTLFTQGYPNLYQQIPSNAVFGARTWYLAQKLNVKNVLLIEDSSIIYSGEYAASFLRTNKIYKDAIKVKRVLGSWTKNKQDILNTVQQELNSNSFDAVFFPGFPNDISSVLEIMESLGLRIPMLAGDEGSAFSIFNNDKVQGLSKVYFLSYYPSVLSVEDNPQTRARIETFNKVLLESGTGSLEAMQLYYSTPFVISEIIRDVLNEGADILDSKEIFYEQFNRIARSKTLTGLLDRAINFTLDGTIDVSAEGSLFISTNSKKEGVQTIGTV